MCNKRKVILFWKNSKIGYSLPSCNFFFFLLDVIEKRDAESRNLSFSLLKCEYPKWKHSNSKICAPYIKFYRRIFYAERPEYLKFGYIYREILGNGSRETHKICNSKTSGLHRRSGHPSMRIQLAKQVNRIIDHLFSFTVAMPFRHFHSGAYLWCTRDGVCSIIEDTPVLRIRK